MAIFDKIGEFAKSATEKAGDKIETSRLNGKIRSEQQAITGYQTELGARYWEKISAGEIEADPAVSDILDKIKESYANIAATEAEIQKIEEERAAAEAAAKAAAEAKAAAAQAATPSAPPYVAPVYEAPPAQPQAFSATPVEASFDTGAPAAPVQGEYSFGAPQQPPVQQPPVQQPPIQQPPIQQPPVQQPVEPLAEPLAAPAGVLCANCGTALSPGAKFCRECGTPAPAPAPVVPVKRFCANCGHELAPGARFCPECGAKA